MTPTSTATTIFAERFLSAEGWLSGVRIGIAEGRIAALEAGAAPRAGDERHAVVIPALPNLHSHAFQRGMAGLAERRAGAADDFWGWRETMYRFALRMTPEQMGAVARMAYVEMLEAGFGRVGEFHYLHHDRDGDRYGDIGEMAARLAEAAGAVGIGLTLLPVFYAHASFGGTPPLREQRRFVNDLDAYTRLVERCRELAPTGIAPHSLRAVTPDELTHLVRLAGDAPIHIHVAEQVPEIRECVRWSGRSPVRWLLDHAPVDERWCLVHATHIDPDEMDGIAASGATVALCPITEANLGDGIFPGAEFLAAGGRFGIGSDSNVRIDAAGELCLLEYSQRLARRERNVLQREETSTGRTLYDSALAAGRVLGPRDAADLVSLVVPHRDGDGVLDGWIFARGAVDCVWVAGSKVVEKGRHRRRGEVADAFHGALRTLAD